MAHKDGSKSGGRQRGTRNRRTVERERMAKEAAEQMIKMRGGVLFEGNSHAFLMSIYQNEAMPVDLRADAAKAALRFEVPNTDQVPYLIITDKNLEQIDFEDGPPRFLVRMPTPVKDLDEWRAKYDPARAGPAAESPERPEQIEDEANKTE